MKSLSISISSILEWSKSENFSNEVIIVMRDRVPF